MIIHINFALVQYKGMALPLSIQFALRYCGARASDTNA
ncbi:unnamed protein product (plasmid) [Mycetohabitans rhizoxinica HKI 454]|uniref:Uncharacterized protein n=1 Tax=Mycetohabitans rhizoxinica (strain DSM 19002 / CIP 109453 / HKI 454) TaxID=882378 RepID=E5AUT1_MYCRK|nr:unnamed protein product [Mycetohabitans rhizoxinica HKI 454]